MELLDELYKKLIFFTGDVRLLHSFPWVTWSKHEHMVDFDEVLAALRCVKFGDIGIHRDWGYLSNVGIPGFMKHAWIHVADGIHAPKIVEAISEGVVVRSALYPVHSDYTILLSPKGATDEERKGACTKAEHVIGEKYDVHFSFDIEKELEFYTGDDRKAAGADLGTGKEFMRKYHYAFSCTELASYSWWHKREQLRLFRKERRGKSVIIADDFLNRSFEITWMSESVTVDNARKLGLHEEGLSMIDDFARSRTQ